MRKSLLEGFRRFVLVGAIRCNPSFRVQPIASIVRIFTMTTVAIVYCICVIQLGLQSSTRTTMFDVGR